MNNKQERSREDYDWNDEEISILTKWNMMEKWRMESERKRLWNVWVMSNGDEMLSLSSSLLVLYSTEWWEKRTRRM